MNDSDQTMSLPIVEVRGESNGTPSRRAFFLTDTTTPPRDTIMSPPAIAPRVDPHQFEPSVFGAIRRYRVMVLALALLGIVAAVAYARVQPKVYETTANITVPLPAPAAASAGAGQFLDSRVLLLRSQDVAEQAAAIANTELGSNVLDASDFSGSGSSLAVDPPTTATPGVYGASIVAVAFKGPSPKIAQAGLSAVLQAFDQAVSNAITTQANATIAGIDAAINQSTSPTQKGALEAQSAQALVNEQTNLAQTPTAAVGPTTRVNGHWYLDGAIGLVVGLIVGSALAYARAVRRRRIAGRQDPAVIYGVPLIAETPALGGRGDLLPMARNPHSAAAEAFRFAVVSVERACAARGMPLSVAFISPLTGAGKSTVAANLILAMAEGGTRLLVVDADPADAGLTARILPGIPIAEGLEQVLSGQRTLAECVVPSPLNDAIGVIGPGPAAPRPVTGAARLRAARAMLAEAKTSFDIVLIDCPALLEVADAVELVNAADASIIVVNPDERISDHRAMVEWLQPGGLNVIGYLYNRAPMRSHVSRRGRDRSAARPVAEERGGSTSTQTWNENRQPSHQPQG